VHYAQSVLNCPLNIYTLNALLITNLYTYKPTSIWSKNQAIFSVKKKKSQRGFGKQTLCETCNNNTGGWYVKDFCSFIKQGMDILTNNQNPYYISGSYKCKPQNVIKQILLMFLAADSHGIVRDLPGVSDYLLNKESSAFPDKVDIYIYSNSSAKKRMLGYCVVYDAGKICKWSEINFRPFGYFLTYDSPPPNEYMVKITDFSKVPYDKEYDIKLNTARLKVDNMLIGHYDGI